MEDRELQEAQRRLEEKRESSKQTDQALIGSAEVQEGDAIGTCSCGKPVIATRYDVLFASMGSKLTSRICAECKAAEEERYRAEQAEREREKAEQERQRRFSQRLEESGIGQKFHGIDWDDYKPTCKEAAAVKAYCQGYADDFTPRSGDIVMMGSCGTGKNMLSSLIGLQLMKRDFSFQYTTAMRLVRRIKDSWRDKESSEQYIIDSFTRPALLCIDEIGVQFGSPTEQLFITEVINNRYEAEKPTILISNLTLKQAEEVLGARAIDRFHERGKFLVFNWPSYRRR